MSAGAASSADIENPNYVATLVEEALTELRTKERRCVAALGAADALLRPFSLPRMSFVERERAARLEAERHTEFSASDAVVRLHPSLENGVWALGIARRSALRSRVNALRAARLKPVAVDHEACAFARALPAYDVIVDVGHRRTVMHVNGGPTPWTLHAARGGADVTSSIGRELAIDEYTAEKRKRILGAAGAGEQALNGLAAEISSSIALARKTRPVVRVALVGNAARLPGLSFAIEAATGAICESPVAEILRTDTYPDDVIRSNAPDWTLAAGLSMWKVQ
jgi:Tfp pilus assembly PilM family ATPase